MPLVVDQRLGGLPRHRIVMDEAELMLVPDVVRKSVGFLLIEHTKNNVTVLTPVGTVFFVKFTHDKQYPRAFFTYVVTARHVISNAGVNNSMLTIRINGKDNKVIDIETNTSDWVFHDDWSVDVAIYPYWPISSSYDLLPTGEEMFVDAEVIEREKFGAGDEILFTGLYANLSIDDKIIPIVRLGSLATFPEEKIYAQLGYGGSGSAKAYIDAYLVEARSIGGLSGSPVFAVLPPPPAREWARGHGAPSRRHTAYFLLGLMQGHFDIRPENAALISDDEARRQAMNAGIAIVVPMTKILEVMHKSELSKGRQKVLEENHEPTASVPDLIERETDDAAFTRPDFLQDLGKVSRRSEPDEETS